MRRLSLVQARRLHLAAQGFADPRPAGRVDVRHLRRVVRRTGLLQIDSVNVVERAHYLPVFSRLGTYPQALLDDATYRRRELFEYWVHEASIVPVELHPLLRHRMAQRGPGRRARALMESEPGYIEQVLGEVADRGPVRAADLSDPGIASGPWWGWSKGKTALEHLFSTGRLAVADREGFVRRYDLTERVLPAAVLRMSTPPEHEARRSLVLAAARHLGVAAVEDLADYHRQPVARVGPLVAQLVAAGLLTEVAVEGWSSPAYVHPDPHIPRSVHAATLLSPFDPVVFHRPRAERLFEFSYRIEIYVPKAQRRYGYYVMPVLVGEAIVGRADVKADRRGGRLEVRGAWWERSADRSTRTSWAQALCELAEWLQLGDIAVASHGDAAADLQGELA